MTSAPSGLMKPEDAEVLSHQMEPVVPGAKPETTAGCRWFSVRSSQEAGG